MTEIFSNISPYAFHKEVKQALNINSFIKDIYDSKESVFVIDFQNKDYFWINEIKLKTLV